MANVIQHLAGLYVHSAPTVPSHTELDLLRGFINDEFQAISVPVIFQNVDITLPECEAIYRRDGVLVISVAHNSHPYLTGIENARFRAIHDWHHLLIGADSTLRGEIATFQYTREKSIGVAWILHSEIVLQAAAALYFGDFQSQKLVQILPREIS